MTEIANGYTKEKYFSISAKQKLPPRCPILRKCSRAAWSRYLLGGFSISFNEFLKEPGQIWNTDDMIEEIEKPSVERSDLVKGVENCCPEIPLFEEQYLPPYFNRQLAFSSAEYFKESKTFTCNSKHFSECPEYSEYVAAASTPETKTTSNKTTRKKSPFSKMQRFETYHRDNFSCFYCKRHKDELPSGVSLTLDHKVPYSDGGDDSPSNIVTACSDCNSGKSNKIVNGI